MILFHCRREDYGINLVGLDLNVQVTFVSMALRKSCRLPPLYDPA